MQLIEAYGTGMEKILYSYADHDVRPRIEATNNSFKIILPNINLQTNYTITANDSRLFIEESAKALSSEEEMILKYTLKQKAITKNEVARLLEVSPSTAIRIIRKMLDDNLLKQNGRARNTKYTLK